MKTALRFHIRKEVCNHERDVWHNLIHAEEVKKSAQTHDHQVLDGEHCRILVSDSVVMFLNQITDSGLSVFADVVMKRIDNHGRTYSYCVSSDL